MDRIPASHSDQPFVRNLRKRRLWITGISLVLVAVVTAMTAVHVAYAAGGTAPNGPGSSSVWSPSNNSMIGTAANTTSDVWFTGNNGILGEIFIALVTLGLVYWSYHHGVPR